MTSIRKLKKKMKMGKKLWLLKRLPLKQQVKELQLESEFQSKLLKMNMETNKFKKLNKKIKPY